MKGTLIVLVGVALVGTASAQSWQPGPVSGFRYTRFDGEFFPGDGKVYFPGGRLSDGNTDGSVWSFDPGTSAYSDVGVDLQTPVSNYDVCLLEDGLNLPDDTFGLYVVGGRTDAGGYTDAVQVYYPLSNTVSTIASDPFPGRAGGAVPVATASLVADNKLYVMGGFSSAVGAMSNEAWVYDPMAVSGSRWTRLPDLNNPRCYIAAALVDSLVYAVGGDTYDGLSLYARAQCERLNLADIASGWAVAPPLPRPTGETRAFGFDSDAPYSFAGHIVVAGRGAWPDESTHCFIHNTATNTWDTFPSINTARRNHAGALVPDMRSDSAGVPGLWIWGGRQGSDTAVLTSCEYYDLLPTGIAGRHPYPRDRQLTVRPNPSRGIAVVHYQPVAGRAAVVRLYDVNGDLVHEDRSGTGRAVIDRRLPAGVYIVRLSQGDREAEQKLVVTR